MCVHVSSALTLASRSHEKHLELRLLVGALTDIGPRKLRRADNMDIAKYVLKRGFRSDVIRSSCDARSIALFAKRQEKCIDGAFASLVSEPAPAMFVAQSIRTQLQQYALTGKSLVPSWELRSLVWHFGVSSAHAKTIACRSYVGSA